MANFFEVTKRININYLGIANTQDLKPAQNKKVKIGSVYIGAKDNTSMMLYGIGFDDYIFSAETVKSAKLVSSNATINHNGKMLSGCSKYQIFFNDGKKAYLTFTPNGTERFENIFADALLSNESEQITQTVAQPAPAPAKETELDAKLKLTQLLINYKTLLDMNAIEKDEYEDVKFEIMDSLNKAGSDDNSEKKLKRKDIYNSAIELKNNNQFDEAIEEFEKIQDYLDSKKQIDECIIAKKEEIYKKANAALSENRYKDAVELYSLILDYKDSRIISEKIESEFKTRVLNEALEKKDEKNFNEAINLLKQLKPTDDILKIIDECDVELKQDNIYSKAIAHFNSGSYEDAKNEFLSLGDYLDSKEYAARCDECAYENIYSSNQFNKTIENSEDYFLIKTCVTNLEKIGNYKDTKQLISSYNDQIKAYFLNRNTIKNKTKKKKMIIAFSIATSAALVISLAVSIPLSVRSAKRREIAQLIEDKNYDKAYSLLNKNGISTSDPLYVLCNAGRNYSQNSWRTATYLITNIDGEVYATFHLGNGSTTKTTFTQSYTTDKVSREYPWFLTYYSIDCSKTTATITLF